MAQTLPSVERVSQRMEGTPRELQISVEDVRLVLEQRNPQVFDALGAIIMNDALLEEAARFTSQIPSVLSLGGAGFSLLLLLLLCPLTEKAWVHWSVKRTREAFRWMGMPWS